MHRVSPIKYIIPILNTPINIQRAPVRKCRFMTSFYADWVERASIKTNRFKRLSTSDYDNGGRLQARETDGGDAPPCTVAFVITLATNDSSPLRQLQKLGDEFRRVRSAVASIRRISSHPSISASLAHQVRSRSLRFRLVNCRKKRLFLTH